MKHSILTKAALIWVIGVIFYASGCVLKRTAAPDAEVPAGCTACHDRLSARAEDIHLSHLSSTGFSGDCRSCHFMDDTSHFRTIEEENKTKTTHDVIEKMAPYFQSWADSTFLDHTHAESGVDCAGCHGTYFPESGLSLDDCLKCHGRYEDLAKATINTEPNPHDSHYMDLRCTLCHKGHQASELYCNTCHDFNLNVP